MEENASPLPVIPADPILYRPIGVIHTPYTDHAPYQPVADAEGEFRVRLFEDTAEGLAQLERFRYVYLLYHVHKVADRGRMVVRPSWLPDVQVGVFASRSPERPNPIGLSVVRLKAVAGGCLITSGLDVFDGTPLLDIKPYIQDLDVKRDADYGWLDDIQDREHLMLHIKGIPHAY